MKTGLILKETQPETKQQSIVVIYCCIQKNSSKAQPHTLQLSNIQYVHFWHEMFRCNITHHKNTVHILYCNFKNTVNTLRSITGETLLTAFWSLRHLEKFINKAQQHFQTDVVDMKWRTRQWLGFSQRTFYRWPLNYWHALRKWVQKKKKNL